MQDLTTHSILVTGGTGFAGSHLVKALIDRAPGQLHATFLDQSETRAMKNSSSVTYHRADLADRDSTARLIDSTRPTLVFHLAGQSHVPTSFKDPETTWRANLNGSLNLLYAVAEHCPGAIFINVGSAEVYGTSFSSGEPATETTPLAPLNPYAASKAAADLAAYQMSVTSDLGIIRARPFNHTGPGHSEHYALPAFAAQIARIELGLQPPVLKTGDLSARRDFLHVSDVIAAYLSLADNADKFADGRTFNIASGESVVIADMLDRMLQKSSVKIDVTTDPEKLRPVDIIEVRGDSGALRAATGWTPRYSKDRLLDDLLAHWRTIVRSEAG